MQNNNTVQTDGVSIVHAHQIQMEFESVEVAITVQQSA
jgi:hypothetical protein